MEGCFMFQRGGGGLFFRWGTSFLSWGEGALVLVGGVFKKNRKMGGGAVPPPLRETLPKVAILLLQDLSTLFVTEIYGIYFHLSVQCL